MYKGLGARVGVSMPAEPVRYDDVVTDRGCMKPPPQDESERRPQS